MSELFEANRPRLIGIAYGMLGGIMDAEDIVQDAYLRWAKVEPTSVESPAAYLTTITTRLAINRLQSAQRRRESYVGPWLPEPIVTEFGADPADLVAEAEQLSGALLRALERLNPVERAVLLLRDVFDLDYNEIADTVDKSPTNCRQIASRARDRAGDVKGSAKVPPGEKEKQLLASYLDAIRRGDLDGVKALFAEDVVLATDGGGVVRAARHPLHGAARVARHLIGVTRRIPDHADIQMVRVNSDPGLILRIDSQPIFVMSIEIADGTITGVGTVNNPEKLTHL